VENEGREKRKVMRERRRKLVPPARSVSCETKLVEGR